jgi:hypothetical protein
LLKKEVAAAPIKEEVKEEVKEEIDKPTKKLSDE